MRRLFTLSLILLCSATFATFAQEDVLRPHRLTPIRSHTPIALGLEAGMNFSFFSQNLQWFYDATGYPSNDPRFAVAESATGFTPFFSALLDIGFSPSIGLRFKMGYDSKNTSNTETGPVACILYDPYGNPYADTTATVESQMKLRFAYLHITPLVRWNLTPSFHLTLGPTLHFPIGTPQFERTDTILSDEGCLFGDPITGTRIVTYQTDLDTLSISPRIGIEMGFEYAIPIARQVWLLPALQFQFFFSNVTKEEENLQFVDANGYLVTIQKSDYRNKLHSLRLALTLLFGL